VSPAEERRVDGGGAPAATSRAVDNTVHDLIALANDLRRHIDADLRRRGYDDRRAGFAPLFSAVWETGIPQVRLARRLGVSAQAASQTVSLAVRAGYVERRPNPDDGRSKLVVITDRGRRFVEHGAVAIVDRTARYEGLVGTSRLRRFRRALTLLLRGLGLDPDAGLVTTMEPRSDLVAIPVLAEAATRALREAMVDRGHGSLRATEHGILIQIGSDGARASEIARVQRVSRQAISALLHEIETSGYIDRHAVAGTKHGVAFVLTTRGQEVVDDYVDGIDAIERRYLAVLGSVRFAEVVSTARELRHRVRLESAIEQASQPAFAAGGPEWARSDVELLDLASDLRAWLGDTDAARLSAVLGRLVVEHGEAR